MSVCIGCCDSSHFSILFSNVSSPSRYLISNPEIIKQAIQENRIISLFSTALDCSKTENDLAGFLLYKITKKQFYGVDYPDDKLSMFVSACWTGEKYKKDYESVMMEELFERAKKEHVEMIYSHLEFQDKDVNNKHNGLRSLGFAPTITLYRKCVVDQSQFVKSSKFTYRYATIEDFDFVFSGRLDILKIEDGLNEFETEEFDQEERVYLKSGILNRQILLAEFEGRPVGFTMISYSKKNVVGIEYDDLQENLCFVNYVYTIGAMRGIGVGQYLYFVLSEVCRAKYVKEIWLDVWTINPNSHYFHLKSDFHPLSCIYIKDIVPQTRGISDQIVDITKYFYSKEE